MGLAFRIAAKRVNAYSESVAEKWQFEHAIAMMLFDFQELMREGVGIFDDIQKIEDDWRSAVLREVIDYSEKVEAEAAAVFRGWYLASQRVLRQFDTEIRDEYCSRKFDLTQAEALRDRVARAEAFLTADGEFFAQDATFDMADNAVEDFKAGRTEPFAME